MGIHGSPGRRAVFLDRDGVINRAVVRNGRPYPPASADALEVLPGVAGALAKLRGAGYRLVVVTNQPDVARGKQSRATIDEMHARLSAQLPIDEFRVCEHDDGDRCQCRKPAPGMIVEAAHDAGVDLAASFMVGDRWRDIEAGRRAGCRTVFIDYGYDEQRPAAPDASVGSLAEAAEWILTSPWVPTSFMKPVHELSISLFADGADLPHMLAMARQPYIKGFTTNPTLMRKAGVSDYRAFAREVLAAIPDRPISFEVLSDEFDEMERQAHEVASWGDNVYVKIPVTNTRRESSCDLVRRLSHSGVKVNVTALMSLGQVREVAEALACGAPSCVSVFAGRIADTGRDPVPLMAEALGVLRSVVPAAQLIWASPRELLNVFQADAIGCHIITATEDILKKLHLVGRDLDDYSLDTVKMFYRDAVQAGLVL